MCPRQLGAQTTREYVSGITAPAPRKTLLLLVGLLAAGLTVAFAWPALRLDYYFDEIWRAAMVRDRWSFHDYFRHDTPIPPGWLVAMWAITSVVTPRRAGLRLLGLAPAVATAVLAAVFLLRAGRRGAGSIDGRNQRHGRHGRAAIRSSVFAGAGAGLVVMAMPGYAQLCTYFNNYYVDVLVGLGIVVLTDRSLIAEPTKRVDLGLLGLAVVAPWFAQSGVFLAVPAIVVLVRHRPGSRADRVRSCVPFVVVLSISSAACYLGFLRRVGTTASIRTFWAGESVRQLGLRRLLGRIGTTYVDFVAPRSPRDSVIVGVVVIVATFAGVVALSRRISGWAIIAVAPPMVAIVASYAAGWPATVVRTNAAAFFPLALSTGYGTLISIDAAVRALTRRRGVAVRAAALFAASSALAVGIWPREVLQASTNHDVFGRGLTDDLAWIVTAAHSHDVVVGYQSMTVFYLENSLRGSAAPGITILSERELGQALYADTLTAETLGAAPTADVWCVVPYDVGPDQSALACRLNPVTWTKVDEHRGERADITHWRPVSVPTG